MLKVFRLFEYRKDDKRRLKEEKPDEILFIIGKGYANPKTGELPNQPRETLTQGDEADPDKAVPLTD